MAIIASTLARIKSGSLECLGGHDRVNEHFALAGHVWRECVLDPANTLALFILQVLNGNTAITHLPHLSGLVFAASSYCEARARLPLQTLARVIDALHGDALESVAQASSWRGRRVCVIDATSIDTPDTPQLQTLWPQGKTSQPGCGFPIIKLLGLLDLASGMILQLTTMCLYTHEMSQLQGTLAGLEAGDVVLADRGFCSFAYLWMLTKASVDAVFRMHQQQIVDFTPGRPHRGKKGQRYRKGIPTSRFVKKLGREDQIVRWIKPAKQPRWMDDTTYAALPETLLVRELRYRITVRGLRTRTVTIATTLLDPMRYPQREIARLYGLRWEIETNFRHLKTTMKMDHLKCKTIDGVMRELMIFVLVYNLVRAAMLGAARRQNIADANRVSFVDALRSLCSSGGRSVIDLVVNPVRPGRWAARVQKRRMKSYDLMTRPRHEYAQPTVVEEVMA
jgi:DDE family transposase